VAKLAAEYLENIDAQPISPGTTGVDTLRMFSTPPPEKGVGQEARNVLPDVMRLWRVQNGRFFGYVLGSGEPVGAAADLLASALNQDVTAWCSAPAGVMVEPTVVSWLAQAIGCPDFAGHELNRLNPPILKHVLERSRVYLSNASVRNKFGLRACM
jgi:glutamate/tyrosine decarboxylase-like PLP-dependent enzyme